MSRRAPWGANIARAVSGDPYMELPKDSVAGESCVDALVRGGHDWTVGLQDVQVAGGSKIDRKAAVVRSDNGYALGVVGKTYRPIQNRDLAAFADDLASEASTTVSAVGTLEQGRRVFAVVDYGEYRPPGFGGNEVVNLSQIVWSRHDGGGSLTAGLFPLRLSCANGMRALIKAKVRSLKIRHTLRADQRLVEARKVLGVGAQAFDGFEEAVTRLLDTEATDATFTALTEQLLPVGDDDTPPATVTRRANARDAMFALWSESPNLDGIRGTAYAAVNAVGEWEQWVRPIRGNRGRDEVHMMSIMNGGEKLTERAASLLLPTS